MSEQSMRDWLEDDAVQLDLPGEEIIQALCEEIDRTRSQRDVLLEACKEVYREKTSGYERYGISDETFDQIKQAIAKAEEPMP